MLHPKTLPAALAAAGGLFFSVLPPAICTLCYFPLFSARGAGAAVCGLSALLLSVAFLPLMRFLRARWRTPSATLLWGGLFLLFFALSKIADEMTVIAFFGFAGNLCGAGLFRLSAHLNRATNRLTERRDG